MWFVAGDDLTGALHDMAQVVTTTSVIFSSIKQANPGSPGKNFR